MGTREVKQGPTSAQVAANVERLRKQHGWTLAELSAKLADIGRPMLPSGLSKIEQKTRRVDVDDLVALAIVFGVNVSTLLFPPTREGKSDVTGAGTVDNDDLWGWADGETPLAVKSLDDYPRALLSFAITARPTGYKEGLVDVAEQVLMKNGWTVEQIRAIRDTILGGGLPG